MSNGHFGKTDVTELIGNTPLVHLRTLSGLTKANIYGKCEFMNPGGSIKERTALGIVRDAERSGKIKPGGTLVEATTGNTGIGVAMVANARGYKSIIVMPDTMSREKIDFVRSYGAEIRLTEKAPWGSPKHYYQVAKDIAESLPNALLIDQFNNPANNRSHYSTTGPEIWRQTEGKIDVFVSTMGTAGTLCGVGKFLKEKNPNVKVVCPDHFGSAYYSYFHTGKIEIVGTSVLESFGISSIPGCYDGSVLDDVLRIDDRRAVSVMVHLINREGLYVGGSSGMAVAGALEYARKIDRPANIVCILADSMNRYVTRFLDEG
ncbi:MAG: pyridoxal-phosphate dependent enzyme, partial [Acidobacteriota bacterium]